MSQCKKSNEKEANSKKIIGTQLRSCSFTFLNHLSLSPSLSSLMPCNYFSGLRACYVEATFLHCFTGKEHEALFRFKELTCTAELLFLSVPTLAACNPNALIAVPRFCSLNPLQHRYGEEHWVGMKSCGHHHWGPTPTSCPPAHGSPLGWADKQPNCNPRSLYVVSQQFSSCLQGAVCTIQVTAEYEQELKLSPGLSTLPRLNIIAQKITSWRVGLQRTFLGKGYLEHF